MLYNGNEQGFVRARVVGDPISGVVVYIFVVVVVVVVGLVVSLSLSPNQLVL